MAITFVGGKVVSVAASTSTSTNISLSGLTGGSDSAPIAGDLVLVGYMTSATADLSPAVTGYTQLVEIYADDNFDTNLDVSYKFMGPTPDSQITVNATGSVVNSGVVAIRVFRDVDSTTPFDVTRTTATGTNGGRPDPPSITPVTAGAVVVAFGAGANNSISAFTATGLTAFQTGTRADSNGGAIGAGHVAWTSGAVNPAAWTGGTTAVSASWAAVTLALRPASISATTTPQAVDVAALVAVAGAVMAAKRLAAGCADAATVFRQIARTLTVSGGSTAQSGRRVAAGAVVDLGLTVGAAASRAFLVAASAVAGIVAQVSRRVGRPISMGRSAAVTLSRVPAKRPAVSVPIAVAAGRASARAFIVSAGVIVLAARQAAKRPAAVSISAGAEIGRQTGKLVAAAMTGAASVRRAISKRAAIAAAASAVASAVRAFLVSVSVTASAASQTGRTTARVLQVASGGAIWVRRQAVRRLTAAASSTAAFSARRALIRAVGVGAAVTAAAGRSISRGVPVIGIASILAGSSVSATRDAAAIATAGIVRTVGVIASAGAQALPQLVSAGRALLRFAKSRSADGQVSDQRVRRETAVLDGDATGRAERSASAGLVRITRAVVGIVTLKGKP